MFKLHKHSSIQGQVSSVDIILGVLLFVLIFTSLRGITTDTIDRTTSVLEANEQQVLAQQAFVVLTNTQGYPTDWNTSSVDIIGIAKRKGVLDPTKVQQFMTMDYNQAKTLLGFETYDFLCTVNKASGNYSLGADRNATAVVERNIMDFNGEKAEVTCSVFR